MPSLKINNWATMIAMHANNTCVHHFLGSTKSTTPFIMAYSNSVVDHVRHGIRHLMSSLCGSR